MRLPVNPALPLMALVLLSACGGGGQAVQSTLTETRSGPAADYPMVIGQPFDVDGVTHTPADTMNYDQVGYAGVGPDGGSGISAAHRTLPLPSYVEVTSLTSGRTILLRLERRGPMTNARLIELSPGAAAQLGMGDLGSLAVRVRRVNPPEQERALLRSAMAVPPRMDTPKPLLDVLMRRLDAKAAPVRAIADAPQSPMMPSIPLPRSATARPTGAAALMAGAGAASLPAAKAPAASAPRFVAPRPAAVPSGMAGGSLIIQIGAFGDQGKANMISRRIGGQITRIGAVWRVRKGPFATRAQAEAALAQVRAQGYAEARIQRAD